MSAITLGGISKPSKGIHLSEDIFAGFNFVLRGGESTQADYIQASDGCRQRRRYRCEQSRTCVCVSPARCRASLDDCRCVALSLTSQVAKGRDTGVSQVTGFTAKISMGNGMQVSGH